LVGGGHSRTRDINANLIRKTTQGGSAKTKEGRVRHYPGGNNAKGGDLYGSSLIERNSCRSLQEQRRRYASARGERLVFTHLGLSSSGKEETPWKRRLGRGKLGPGGTGREENKRFSYALLGGDLPKNLGWKEDRGESKGAARKPVNNACLSHEDQTQGGGTRGAQKKVVERQNSTLKF